MHTVLLSPSAQSGVLNLRKRSRCPWFRIPAPSTLSPPRGPHSAKAMWSSPFSAKAECFSPPLPKPSGPLLGVVAAPGFKSQCQSSSAAPTPPTIGHSCRHSQIFTAFLGCRSNSRQVWPCGVEAIFPKFLCRLYNQGGCPPVTS